MLNVLGELKVDNILMMSNLISFGQSSTGRSTATDSIFTIKLLCNMRKSQLK
jgi:hypothetical protein